MEIKSKKIKKNEYQFICDTYENRYNWGHKVKLLKNGHEIARQRITYYNRTWECYRYQSCMNSALNIAIDEDLKRYINDYKEENGKTRLKQEEKEALQKNYKKTENGRELYRLKKLVNGNGRDFKNQYYNMEF